MRQDWVWAVAISVLIHISFLYAVNDWARTGKEVLTMVPVELEWSAAKQKNPADTRSGTSAIKQADQIEKDKAPQPNSVKAPLKEQPGESPEKQIAPSTPQTVQPSDALTDDGKTEGQAIIPPVLRQRPSLIYPEAARLQKLTGTVILTAEVSVDGALERIAVFRSSGFPELDAAAREHVRQWRFSPARQAANQKPVKVTTQIRIRFGGEGS